MTIHRVKVTFKDEPGEGSGVARSFYTAVGEAFFSGEKLPPLEPSRSKLPFYQCCRDLCYLFTMVFIYFTYNRFWFPF